jgi:mannose-1-phosphate guanylyltransferase
VRAVVLVGGEGTRLRPLTFTTPKPLLPIANRPFLEWQLAWLGAHGVKEVVLSVGYLPDAFRAHFPDERFEGLELSYAVEREPLGTAGGIRFAAEGVADRFVVCNGDVLTALDLDAMVRFHDDRRAEATISLTRVEDPSAFGVVPTRADGEVVAFVEKPPPGQAPTDWINAGTYVLEPSVLDLVPPRLNVSIERETFPRMLERRRRLFALQSADYWLDIGTPEKYLQAQRDVLGGALGPVPCPGAVEREPGIWVQGDVDVAPTAVLEPPVLLGAGCNVSPGARISQAVLGPGCDVGRDARVEGSVLLEGARVERDAAAVSSVLGPAAVLEQDVVASDHTVLGAGAAVARGSRVSSARIHVER